MIDILKALMQRGSVRRFMGRLVRPATLKTGFALMRLVELVIKLFNMF